jgi:hypothetical protein
LVAVGAFDGDANADLALSTPTWESGAVAILLGRGDGSFGDPTQYTFGQSSSSLATADFNADTVLDVATTDFGADPSSGLLVLLGAGDGAFLPRPDTSTPTARGR